MQEKPFLASITMMLVLTGAASAQNALDQSDAGLGARPHLSDAYRPPHGRSRSDARRNGPEPSATQPIGLQNVLNTVTGDVTGVLNTIFGIRNGRPDDPSAVARE